MLKIYGDRISGNCLKAKWTADYLGIAYEWVETSVLDGATRSPAFLTLNPAGQVPLLILADGRTLAQSNAIITFLAEGSRLIPDDPYARAKMFEWLFWEQYSHEPYIAVARFHVRYLGKAVADLDSKLIERGNAALSRLDEATETSDFLLGDRPTLADVSLVAYTRCAGEGGFVVDRYAALRAWIRRVEAAFAIEPL